jgi:type I restriction enzyme S subunit
MTYSSERDLPSGWQWTRLVEVAELKGGIQKGKKRKPGDKLRTVPYLRVANVQRGYLDLAEVTEIPATEAEIEALRLRQGDVLFNEGGDRDKLGRGWVWNGELEKCIHQNHVFRARLVNGCIEPKLLSFWGNSAGQKYFFDEGKQTTNLASLNMAKLGALPVPVPPVDEQVRLVAELESYLSRLDDTVATLERVQRNLKRYRASVLKAAVEGRLVPTEAELARKEGRDYEPADVLLARILKERKAGWIDQEAEKARAKAEAKAKKAGKPWTKADDKAALDKGRAAATKKYKEPEPPNTSKLSELPEGWCWTTAIAACEQVVDCHNKTAPYVESGIPLLRTTNIRHGRLVLDPLKFVDEPTYAFWSRRCPPQPDDLLFTREAPMGEAALVPAGMKVCMGQRMMLLRANPQHLLPRYLLLATQAPYVFEYADRLSVGVGVQHLRVRDVNGLPIPLPPVSEQARIVAEAERHISFQEEVQVDTGRNLVRSQRLRQSILKAAFEGKLVNQDPTDEPAAVLLERIRTERKAAQAGAKENGKPARRKKKAARKKKSK